MFLFKRFYHFSHFLDCVIYITVCFYLNLLKVDQLHLLNIHLHYSMFLFEQTFQKWYSITIGHLHYSMFLFKLVFLVGIDKTFFIYITVCFYLNLDAKDKMTLWDKIYITVCFYLNKIKRGNRKRSNRIYITVCFYLNQLKR